MIPWPGFGFFGQPSPAAPVTPPGQYAWSTDHEIISMSILACEEGCTSHSEDVHDAIRTLRAYRAVPNHHLAIGGWNAGAYAWTMVPTAMPGAGDIQWPVATPAQELVHLPVPQTMQNAELLSTCT